MSTVMESAKEMLNTMQQTLQKALSKKRKLDSRAIDPPTSFSDLCCCPLFQSVIFKSHYVLFLFTCRCTPQNLAGSPNFSLNRGLLLEILLAHFFLFDFPRPKGDNDVDHNFPRIRNNTSSHSEVVFLQ